MDDDRARHLEDEAGGIVGRDVMTERLSLLMLTNTQNLHIHIQTDPKANEREREKDDGKMCVVRAKICNCYASPTNSQSWMHMHCCSGSFC
jgi:hypothetical protein